MNTKQFINPFHDKTNVYSNSHFTVELPPLEETKFHSFYKVIDERPNFLGSVIAVKDGQVMTQCVTVNGCKAELKKKSLTY
jgi:hypothetical protein